MTLDETRAAPRAKRKALAFDFTAARTTSRSSLRSSAACRRAHPVRPTISLDHEALVLSHLRGSVSEEPAAVHGLQIKERAQELGVMPEVSFDDDHQVGGATTTALVEAALNLLQGQRQVQDHR
jgi:hypothetical protein